MQRGRIRIREEVVVLLMTIGILCMGVLLLIRFGFIIFAGHVPDWVSTSILVATGYTVYWYLIHNYR